MSTQQRLGPPVPAVPADAARIAEIHMAAFNPNAMLLAQFPTPEARRGLLESIRVKALADIADPKISVLVVRCCDAFPCPSSITPSSLDHAERESGGKGGKAGEEGEKEKEKEKEKDTSTARRDSNSGGLVVAFAKWSHPLTKKDRDEGYKETDWIWPPGTNMQILNAWGEVLEEAERRFMGDGNTPFYRLSFMGTDPSYERRGAASRLVKWGIERCEQEGVPAYLEGTLNAAAFYEKMGFRALDRISLRYELDSEENRDWVYQETVFRYDPA